MNKIFSKIFLIIGTLFFVISFSASDMYAPGRAVALLTGLLIIGSLFIIIGLRLQNIPRKVDFFAVQTENKNENNINYAEEFENLYNFILLSKVNDIIKEGENV